MSYSSYYSSSDYQKNRGYYKYKTKPIISSEKYSDKQYERTYERTDDKADDKAFEKANFNKKNEINYDIQKEKAYDKNYKITQYDKGGSYDKNYDKKYSRANDKIYERTYERKYDRPVEKAYNYHSPIEKSYEKSYDKAYLKPNYKSYEENFGKKYEKNYERNYGNRNSYHDNYYKYPSHPTSFKKKILQHSNEEIIYVKKEDETINDKENAEATISIVKVNEENIGNENFVSDSSETVKFEEPEKNQTNKNQEEKNSEFAFESIYKNDNYDFSKPFMNDDYESNSEIEHHTTPSYNIEKMVDNIFDDNEFEFSKANTHHEKTDLEMEKKIKENIYNFIMEEKEADKKEERPLWESVPSESIQEFAQKTEDWGLNLPQSKDQIFKNMNPFFNYPLNPNTMALNLNEFSKEMSYQAHKQQLGFTNANSMSNKNENVPQTMKLEFFFTNIFPEKVPYYELPVFTSFIMKFPNHDRNELVWFSKDNKGVINGPFDSAYMDYLILGKHLSESILIAWKQNIEFISLSSFLKNPIELVFLARKRFNLLAYFQTKKLISTLNGFRFETYCFVDPNELYDQGGIKEIQPTSNFTTNCLNLNQNLINNFKKSLNNENNGSQALKIGDSTLGISNLNMEMLSSENLKTILGIAQTPNKPIGLRKYKNDFPSLDEINKNKQL